MSDILFSIPSKREDLLKEATSYYSVRNVYVKGELLTRLTEARNNLKTDGSYFILENFDVYYSILHHADKISEETFSKAFQDLEKATTRLVEDIRYQLENKNSITDDLKRKNINTMTMLLYIFIQFASYIEQKESNEIIFKDKNKQKKSSKLSIINKNKFITILNNIIQQEINIFWSPQLIDETFINMIADINYQYIKNQNIKNDKELINIIFGLFGNMIKLHNYCKSFVFILIHYIRTSEHLVNIVPDGIQFLIQHFHCKEIVHHLIKEATEWQGQENYEDQQGSRNCSLFITNLGTLMPDLILPELEYLNKFLNYDIPTFRTSVINIYTQVLLNVLKKHDITDMEKEIRNDLFQSLIEHIWDCNSGVRSKVIQNFAKLQKENAIPLTLQDVILEKIIKHLYDKTASVRKSAINCVTAFLTYNTFGANLQLCKMKEELIYKKELLDKLEADFQEMRKKKIEEKKEAWEKMVEPLREVIVEELKIDEEKSDDNDVEEENAENPPIEEQNMKEIVQMYLKEGKYVEAFKLCRNIIKKDIDKMENKPDDVSTLYMFMFQTIYNDINIHIDTLRVECGLTTDDIEKINVLEQRISYCENAVKFLTLIDNALIPMKELLFTTNISDMHEAINFFVTAYRFQIDNISDGIMSMLNLMKQKEQDRKEAVVAAFKEMYLNTDSKNLLEHTITIVDRLISILNELPVENEDDFQDIVSNWTAKHILDNSVIDTLWKYFAKNLPVSDLQSNRAVELLRLASIGRKTIITKNIQMVATVAFGERGHESMEFLANSCRLLAVAGREKIDINSKEPIFKLSYNDQIFDNLLNILIEKFFQPIPYYSYALDAAIDFIYRLSSKPTAVCEKLFYEIMTKLTEKYCNNENDNEIEFDNFILDRLANLLGNVALKQLTFMDDTVYRELKRRHFVRESKNNNNSTNQSALLTASAKKANKNKTAINSSSRSVLQNSRLAGATANSSVAANSNKEESMLEGAQAEDTDAEFILNVLENDILSPSSLLGHFTKFLIFICQRPKVFTNVVLQGTAVTALMRYMLMSSKFCNENIRLIFAILENTPYEEVKRTILIHSADLLTRFPNIVEPYMPKVYTILKDESVRVRKIAFFAISTLILRDMIRAHSHISEMAVCLIDKEPEIKQLCIRFFLQLVQKDNNLTNILPDIFSHLVKIKQLTEEDLREILRFLFAQIDSSKKIENLVDRFCNKFCLANDDTLTIRNIAFCLSLITYNEKALRKLSDNFGTYKHLLHDTEVLTFLKQILNQCSKQKAAAGKADLKPIVAEIENNIQQMLAVNDENNPSQANQSRLMPAPKGVAPKRKKRPTTKKTKKSKSVDDEDGDGEDSDDEYESSPAPVRTKRGRLNRSSRTLSS